jgi:uncharacterized protein
MNMSETSRPLPRIDEDSQLYWVSAHDHALKLQQCDNCGQYRFYPSHACHFCQSLSFHWQPVSGRGEVYTYSVLLRARGNPFEDLLPLIVVLVKLEEGPVMMSNLFNCEPEAVRIGMPVTLSYEDVNGEVTLPIFVPSGESAGEASQPSAT